MRSVASCPPTAPYLGCLLALGLFGCPRGSDSKLEAEGNYVAAQAAYLKGDFGEAHRRFAEVRRLNPSEPRLPAAEGEVFLAESRIDDALAQFEAALQLDPQRATTWSRLGSLYALKKRPEKALRALRTALEKNPRDSNALESMADLQLEGGDVDAGIEGLLRASAVAPSGARGPLVVKATAELGRRGRDPEALAALEWASAAGVQSAEVMSELGDRLVRAGRFAEAVPAYTLAAQQSPKDPSLWELVGELEVRQGHHAEARAAFTRSLAIQDRAVVHVALSRLCQAKGETACVAAELDLALSRANGEELRESLDLADLLASVGRERDALALFRTVSEEPEQRGNGELQLKTARLAARLRDAATAKAACARALAASPAVARCP